MDDRNAGWVGTISERVLDAEEQPVVFSADELRSQDNLFAHRAALFYTPTSSIPEELVGSGPLQIFIPLVTPDWTEAIELRSPRSPRFWVDQVQRQTMMLRWKPFETADVVIIRYDYYKIRHDHLVAGIKALLDAFKFSSTGRSDGRCLFYFGAIADDGPSYIDLHCHQEWVDHPSNAHTEIGIQPKATT